MTLRLISDVFLTTYQRFGLYPLNTMTYRLLNETKPTTRRPVWLQLLLLLGFLISLLIGLAALIGLYLLEQPGPAEPPAESLVSLIQPAQIPPHLALLQLAGADAEALGRQAVNARERALGYAVLRYDDTLSGPRRATELLRLGQQFVEAGEMPEAIDAYRAVRSVGMLVPGIAPLERGQILGHSAMGLLEAGAEREAVETAQQAQHMAIQSPDLLPAQRAQILERVAPILRRYGSPEEARQIDEVLRGPNLGLNRVSLVSRWSTLQVPVPVDAALQETMDRRETIAQALIDRLVLTGGQDIEAEREALRQALMEEDRLRGERYARLNEPGLTLAQQHTLVQEQRAWLLLKLRIALGGLGLRLMPEWEGQPDAIRLSLSQVTSNLVPVLEAQIAAESDPVSAAMLRIEALRWLVYQNALGYYPNAPLGELATQIDAAEAELEQLGAPPALPIFYDANATPPGFRIARRY